MDRHIRIAGWLNIVWGLLWAVIGLVFMLDPEAVTNGGWIGEEYLLVFWLGAVIALLSLPYIIGGVGLLKGWRWARFLAAVLIILEILSFPLGTAVGIYTLWALAKTRPNARLV